MNAASTRVRTMADFRAFQQALAEVGEISNRLGAMCTVANTTILADPLNDATPAFGIAVMQKALEEFEAVVSRFEAAAVRLLEEKRREGETGFEYVHRVADMVDGTIERLDRVMTRKGLVLLNLG